MTLLALGNGAPNIFSAMVAVDHKQPQLAFGQLLGTGVFVTTCVAGEGFDLLHIYQSK